MLNNKFLYAFSTARYTAAEIEQTRMDSAGHLTKHLTNGTPVTEILSWLEEANDGKKYTHEASSIVSRIHCFSRTRPLLKCVQV